MTGQADAAERDAARATSAARKTEIEQLEQELMLASGRAAALAAELKKCADELDAALEAQYQCFIHRKAPDRPTLRSMQAVAAALAALGQKQEETMPDRFDYSQGDRAKAQSKRK